MIDRIDVQPILLVVFLLALVMLLLSAAAPRHHVAVNLPAFEAIPIEHPDSNFIVTITTTDVQGAEPGTGYLGASRSGNCRVYWTDGSPVSAQDLYDRAFDRLELLSPDYMHPWRYPTGYYAEFSAPRFYIRADAETPWHCVGGVVYILEATGYETIGLLSAPRTTH